MTEGPAQWLSLSLLASKVSLSLGEPIITPFWVIWFSQWFMEVRRKERWCWDLLAIQFRDPTHQLLIQACLWQVFRRPSKLFKKPLSGVPEEDMKHEWVTNTICKYPYLFEVITPIQNDYLRSVLHIHPNCQDLYYDVWQSPKSSVQQIRCIQEFLSWMKVQAQCVGCLTDYHSLCKFRMLFGVHQRWTEFGTSSTTSSLNQIGQYSQNLVS